MATVFVVPVKNEYPTSDGKPMAETDWHRVLMIMLIQVLDAWYAKRRKIYVSGNLLIYYVKGNKRKHVAPDVFVVKGVPKRKRLNFLVWVEGQGPDFIIELTSSSTRAKDEKKNFLIYQNILKVQEYFLFDPLGDYLKPPLKGYRLVRGKYAPIEMVDGRLPSRVLGLHLERDGSDLRFYHLATRKWLPTPAEVLDQESTARQEAQQDQLRAEAARREAEHGRLQAEAARQQAQAAQQVIEAENVRLRREIEELRRLVRNDK